MKFSKPSPLLSIFLIVLVDILGLTIVMPLLPLFAERLGATPFVVGGLVSSYALCQLLAGPVLGRLSDKIGRKPVLIMSQVGTFIGFLVLAFSHSLFWVFLSRVIDGLTAGNLSVAQAYVSDVTRAQDRAKSFGLIGAAFGLGFLVGPAFSAFLSRYGLHVPILAAAACSAASILASSLLLSSSVKVVEPDALTTGQPAPPRLFQWGAYREALQNPPLKSRLWQFTAFAFGFAIFMSGLALFSERRFTLDGRPFGVREIGFSMAYLGLVGLLLQAGFVGKLVRWLGEGVLVGVGFCALLLGYVLLGEVQSIFWLHVALSTIGVGIAVLRPCLTSLITQQVSRNAQGMVLGLTQSITSLAQIFGPLLGGLLIEHNHLHLWAWAPAVLSVWGLGLSLRKPPSITPANS